MERRNIRGTDGSGFAQPKDTSWLYAVSRCGNSNSQRDVITSTNGLERSARLCPLCLPQR
ncbi:Sphingomyelin synthase-related 1, putative [Brugia malayi]|uniref:Bm4286 n=1 Tax=Brugia malayi TaxID=6279 RepID=A0A1U7F3R8_BRUMA|nr:Sphingomyelin synthase-related 1, putative [Brugia malayi]CRZ22705.1 Bm4286 [Brugia malayi]VIO88584.1 Sphingomyelin synthase-related 1, putative [Brugia malayi]